MSVHCIVNTAEIIQSNSKGGGLCLMTYESPCVSVMRVHVFLLSFVLGDINSSVWHPNKKPPSRVAKGCRPSHTLLVSPGFWPLDLPQVDLLIFLVMAQYIGTIKIEKGKNPRNAPGAPQPEEIVWRTLWKSRIPSSDHSLAFIKCGSPVSCFQISSKVKLS